MTAGDLPIERMAQRDTDESALTRPGEASGCFEVFSDFDQVLKRVIPLRTADFFTVRLLGDFPEAYRPQRIDSGMRQALLDSLRDRLRKEMAGVAESRERFHDFTKRLQKVGDNLETILDIHRSFLCWVAETFLSDASILGLQQRLTEFRRSLTKALLARAEAAMVAEGFGPVPAPYAWMSLGSDGRGEQLFATDQDNLLVYEATEASQEELIRRLTPSLLTRLLRFDQGETEADKDKIDLTGRYFWRFCQKMGDFLDAAGIDRCKGHIMPAYDKWRGTLSRWERRLIGKVRYGAGELSILDMNILMDCRFVAGDEGLADRFMALLATYLPENPDILNQIAHSAILMPIALGMFKRLKVKRSGSDKGTLDLKLNGWAPLTILVRVLCVKNRLMKETHTLKRLKLLASHKLLEPKIAEALKDAYYHLMVFRALYQIHRLARGLPKSNAIDPSWLDEEGQDLLRRSLNTVEALQDQINRSFFGGAV